jgi:alkanesulfonate monooxygenase SsuD/methylene tetrahydromethanopterin reductase-like flavin-dependent oxidoreductase (luciferase family)
LNSSGGIKTGYSLGTLLSIDEILRFSRLANDYKNVHSLWVPETWGREAFSTLGAISQVAQGPKLGTAILNIYSRTPSTIAMGGITLDFLSGNRTLLGLGVSTSTIIEDWHGLAFDKPLARMREMVTLLRLIWAGNPVSFKGDFFNVSNFKLLYPPLRSSIPIFLAAVNPLMIALSLSVAEGLLLYLRPFNELRSTVQRIRRDIMRPFELASAFICSISDAFPDKARMRAAKTLAFYISVGVYYRKLISSSGFANETESIVEEYNKRGLDAASKIVSDKLLDEIAICGGSEQGRRSLQRFISSGITLPILQINPVEGEDTQKSFIKLLETFSNE